MKPFKLLPGIIMLLWVLNANTQTIVSTSTGGDWNSFSTWVGNTVPVSTDNVEINGPVSLDFVSECNNLTINMSGAVFQSNSNGWLNIYGNLINNGVFDISPGNYLTINLYGNLTNNGLFTNYQIVFNGTGDKTIIASSLLMIDYVGVASSGSNIILGSNVHFTNCNLNTNTEYLDLNGYTLEWSGSEINGNILGGSGTLKMNNGAYLSSVNISEDITFLDEVLIAGTCHSTGNIINEDTLCNFPYFFSDLSVDGSFINNGEVIDAYGFSLIINCSGNLTNNGVLDNSTITLSGSGIQELVTTSVISSDFFLTSDTIGQIIAMSDLSFSGTSMIFYSEELFLNGYELFIIQSQLDNIIINSDNGKLNMSGDSRISNTNIYGEIELKGNVQIYGVNNFFFGNVTLSDTLQNHESFFYSANFKGDLYNFGIIRDNVYTLTVNCEKNIYNNGTWNNTTTNLTGNSDQYVALFNNQSIGGVLSMAALVPGSTTYNWFKDNVSLIGESLGMFSTENGPSLETTGPATIDYLGTYYCSTNAGNSRNIILLMGQSPITVDAGQDLSICIGNSLTTATTIYGGIGTYSFLWSTGETTQNITVSPLVTTEYFVTVYDVTGSENSNNLIITVNNNPVIDLGSDQEICSGQAAIFEISSQGTYIWSTGSISPVITPELSGNYSVTFTDQNGCQAIDNASLTVNPIPTVNLGADLTLPFGSTPTLDAGAGFTGYNWSNGMTTQTIIATTSGLYSVTITDNNGCTNSDDVHVTINNQGPVFTVNLGADHTLCEGENITLIPTMANGTPPITYLWSDGSTSSQLQITASVTATYSVTVTGGNSATATDEVLITVNPGPTVDIGPDTTLCDGNSLVIWLFEPGTYLWSTGATMNHFPISTAGNYSVTVTNFNGCSTSDDINVGYYPLPLVDLGMDIVVPFGSSVTLDGGTGFTSYIWSNGMTTQTINVTISGFYSVTVTDNNGCTNSDEIHITVENEVPVFTVSLGSDHTLCEGETIILTPVITNGTSPFTYTWSDGSTAAYLQVTASVTTTYSVTITDAGLISASDEVLITVNPIPAIDLGPDISSCDGNSLVIFVFEPGTYLWSTGSTMDHILVSAAGNYSVTVTNTNGCNNSDDINVIYYPLPTVNLGADITQTSGTTATLDAGAGFVSYQWSNGESTQTISVTTNGIFSVTVTDLNGCSNSDDIHVEFTGTTSGNLIIGNNITVCSGTTVTIEPDTTYGTPPFTYSWNNGATTETITITPLFATQVGLIVTDYYFMQFVYNSMIIVADPVVDLGPDITITQGMSAVLDAGSGFSSYYWSTGETTQTISVTTSGLYAVTVTDNTGCTNSDEIIVTVDNQTPTLTVSLGPDQTVCEGDIITLTPAISNGTPPISYMWSDGSTSPHLVLSATSTAVYSVTITDGNGSVATVGVLINVNPNPVVDLGSDTTLCEGTILFIYANATGTYQWSNGLTWPHIPVETTGNYSVTVTNGNGCMGIDDINVSFYSLPVVDLGPDVSISFGSNTTLYSSITGGSGSYIYQWDNVANLIDPTAANAQTTILITSQLYNLTVTDAISGCEGTDDVTVFISGSPLEIISLTLPADICSGDAVQLNVSVSGGTGVNTYSWTSLPPGFASSISNPIVSPTQTTIYLISVTDGITIADSSVVITVNPNPVIDLGPDTALCDGNSLVIFAFEPGTYLWSTGSTMDHILVSTAGNYSVTVTNANGCIGSDDINVNYYSLPVVNLGPDISSCEGSVEDLHANLTGTYNWSTGSANSYILVTTSGNYSLTITDSNGCSGSDEVHVIFNPLPVVDLGLDQTITLGNSYTFEAGTGFSSYEWSNGATIQEVTVSEDGLYSVTVTDNNGCTGSDEVYLNVVLGPNGPGWPVVNTGIMHTILIPDTADLTIDGNAISLGDYIGVFYDSLGTPACGGYTAWTGQTSYITAWGDDIVTTDKDGFATGEQFSFVIWQLSTGLSLQSTATYIPQPVMPDQGNYVVNGLSGILSLHANTVDYQYINLPQGWSYFSTYIDLFNPAIDQVLANILPSVIISKDGDGNTYWPQWSLNTIGNLQIGRGYQIKLTNAQVLVTEGVALVPELTPITVPAGWSMLGYLRQSPSDIVSIFSQVVNDVIIVKNSDGNTYWPQWGLNTIVNMYPGQGYPLKMAATVQLIYPANSIQLKSYIKGPGLTRHFKDINNTGSNMTLGIPLEAWNTIPEIGDELGVFNQKGQLVGASVFEGGFIGISIWGKDQNDLKINGLEEGEKFFIKLWKKSENSEVRINEISFIEGDDMYFENALSVVSKITLMEQLELSICDIQVFPNPVQTTAHLKINSGSNSHVELSVYNSIGEKVIYFDKIPICQGVGNIDIDVSKLPSGQYFINVLSPNSSYSRSFEIIK